MARRKANVNESSCVACGVCASQCPKGIISIFKGCYAVIDTESCVGCGICAKACPANAITVNEVQEVANGSK
ncbi:MAG: 4Fe-4S binding protein [Pseudobutyrivibrio sp.]|nr:4Fe-4S binding protein [Pseudobutyrivibrio sp.]